MGNAVVHGRSAGVTLHDSARCVRIVVDDDGPRIPSEELRRVLAPFVRLDTAQGPASRGAGLGLAIARDAAALHGGELTLENRAEGGLRATLVLPRRPATPLAGNNDFNDGSTA